MFSLAHIVSGLISLANRIGEWLQIKKAEKTGEERQELRSRRAANDRTRRSQNARRRAEHDAAQRLRDAEGDNADSG